jgi:hypothetical protein
MMNAGKGSDKTVTRKPGANCGKEPKLWLLRRRLGLMSLARRRKYLGIEVNHMAARKSQLKLTTYRTDNRLAAEIIAADQVRYPPDSLPAIWAAMILNSPAKPENREAI